MLRYKILGNSSILVDLQNGYKVMTIGNWNKENNDYIILMYLKENNIGILDEIEPDEPIIIKSSLKELKHDLAVCITDLFNEGFFDKYIDRYDYMMNCFEKGTEHFESERIDY